MGIPVGQKSWEEVPKIHTVHASLQRGKNPWFQASFHDLGLDHFEQAQEKKHRNEEQRSWTEGAKDKSSPDVNAISRQKAPVGTARADQGGNQMISFVQSDTKGLKWKK